MYMYTSFSLSLYVHDVISYVLKSVLILCILYMYCICSESYRVDGENALGLHQGGGQKMATPRPSDWMVNGWEWLVMVNMNGK